jgi:hypothetical protein
MFFFMIDSFDNLGRDLPGQTIWKPDPLFEAAHNS